MAGQADGSIYVNTELDPEGFKAGSERMKGAIKSLSAQVKQLGPSLKQAVKGNVDALQSFKGKSDELRASIAEIEAEMEALGHKPVATDAYAELCNQVEKAEQTFERLIDRQDKMKALGVSENSAQWKSLQYDIEKTVETMERLNSEKKQLETSFGAFIPSADTSQYDALVTKLAEVKEQLAGMRQQARDALMGQSYVPYDRYAKLANQLAEVKGKLKEVQQAAQSADAAQSQNYAQLANQLAAAKAQLAEMESRASRTEEKAHGIGAAFRKVGTAISAAARTAGGALLNGLKAALSATKKLVVGNRDYKKSFSGMTSIIKKVGMGLLGVRGVYSLLRKAVSAYMSANTNLANQLSSCWTSLGNVLGPIITRIISLVSTAISYVTALLKLFGLTSSAAASTAEAAGSAGGAAEKAQKSLTGFDEINALQDNSSGGGGGGGGGSSIGSALPDVTLPDWVELMVEQLKAGDWAMAATTLTNRLDAMVACVDWAGIGDKIGYYLNGALTFLAAAIMTFDWEALGTDLGTCLEHIITNVNWRSLGVILTAKFAIVLQTLAGFFSSLSGESISTALTDFMYGTVDAADWVGIAASLSQNVSRFVSEIDFTGLAQALSAQIRTALQSMIAAVDNFDWAMLGRKIANFINGIDWGGIFSDLVALLGKLLVNGLSMLVGFVEEVDWEQLGNSLWKALESVFTDIDWSELVSLLFKGLALSFTWPSDLIDGFVNGLIDSLIEAWDDVKASFEEHLQEAGGDAMLGFLLGCIDAIADIGNWIVENIWNPFVEGFKSAFGIHSPSTKMAEQGGYIVEGLLQGITDAWGSITDWFSEALSSIGDSISETWDDVVAWTENAWSDVSSAISDAWSDVKSTVSAGYEKVKSGVSSAWTTISSKTSSAWSNVKSSLSSSWTNIKSNTSTAWNNVKSSLSTAWSGIKTTAASGYDAVKSGVASAWISTQTDTTGSWTNIKSALSTSWSGIKTAASDGYNAVKNGVTSAWDSIKSSTSSAWSNIKSTIQNQGWSSLGGNIASGIKTGISNGWSTLTSFVRQKAQSLLSTAKSALGIHSPSRLFRDEVGLNIGLGIGAGVEDSESSVLKSVTGVADAIAAEFNAGEYNVKSIVPTAEIDGAITSFTDSITDSFTALMEKLDAIAKRVTFSVPAFAGSVVPYQVSASGNRNSANGADSGDGELVRVMENVSNRQNALLREQNNLLRQLLEKDTIVSAVIGTGDLVSGLSRKNRRDGKTVVPVGT